MFAILRVLVLSLAALLTGCASITGSSTQPISVETTQGSAIVAGASCTLTNDAGKWYVKTPGSVTVKKSTGDMTVECAKFDAAGHDTLVSKANTNVWGNILAGGVIGYVVDRNSGAGFDYPGSVSIKLGGGGSGSLPGSGAMAATVGAGGDKAVRAGRWRALMSCTANQFRQDRPAYQANFQAEVNGDRVTLHRKNKVLEEVLSGTIAGDALTLTGMGYRIENQNQSWPWKFSGNFAGNGKIYTANGDQLTRNGRTARTCTLVMIHTEIAAPVKEGDGDAQ